MAADPQQPQQPGVVREAPIQDAIRQIFAPVAAREGFRHGALGASGSGKTYHLNQILEVALRARLVEMALTHDVKGRRAEFDGIEVSDPDALRQWLQRDPKLLQSRPHVVFRGNPIAGVECKAEAVAAVSLQMARRGRTSLLTIGELDDAVSGGSGRSWGSPSARLHFTQGRAIGASVLYTTQSPQRLPNEAIDQASSVSFFHMEGRSLSYLDDRLKFDPQFIAAVSALPPRKFVLYVPGRGWDGCVYGH